MLPLMIRQLRHRRLLPPVPFGPFQTGQASKPAQVLAPPAHFEQLKLESLMFAAAWHMARDIGHWTPVENLRIQTYADGEEKANIIFALYSPYGLHPRFRELFQFLCELATETSLTSSVFRSHSAICFRS
jgi:hypothetical protein